MAEVVVRHSSVEAGRLGADIIAESVAARPETVLGLATGGTPLAVYQALADRVDAGLDMSGVRGFALDEYVGLPPGHPESYRQVLLREVVGPLGWNPAQLHTPDPDEEQLHSAGERYEHALTSAGGVDVQILGIGTDGHIGFNEPGSSLGSLTRVKTLSAQTRRDNARFFAGEHEVPRLCITQGIGTILRARHLVLLAFGEAKADAVAAAIEGPLSANTPGSAIQLHPHVTVLLDEPAASKLTHLDFYRAAEAGKPAWQRY